MNMKNVLSVVIALALTGCNSRYISVPKTPEGMVCLKRCASIENKCLNESYNGVSCGTQKELCMSHCPGARYVENNKSMESNDKSLDDIKLQSDNMKDGICHTSIGVDSFPMKATILLRGSKDLVFESFPDKTPKNIVFSWEKVPTLTFIDVKVIWDSGEMSPSTRIEKCSPRTKITFTLDKVSTERD
jgi:hypothetical protein